MAKDPVCGMDVEVENALYRTRLEHETFYFCSKACQDSFEVEQGIATEDRGQGFFKRTLKKILKEPKQKPPSCH